MEFHVLPECYADTNLIKTIAPPQTQSYNHKMGCNNVVREMMNGMLKDKFALGIIDRDKRQPQYVSEFRLICEINGSLQLLKHPQRHHYIIFIMPAIEMWILNNAQTVGVTLTNFDLPPDLDELRRITKISTSEDYAPLRRLFLELQRRGAKDFKVLEYWVDYLKRHNYNSNLDVIKAETGRLIAS